MHNCCKVLLIIASWVVLMVGCQNKYSTMDHNVYHVMYTNDTPDWTKTNLITSLTAPWNNHQKDNTIFQAAYNDSVFFFRFIVRDNSQDTYDSSKESNVALGDRVEMFFSADSSLNNYYCLELAPNGNTLDYHASFYRKFDDTWNLTGLTVYTTNTDTGYTVQGTIPLSFFDPLFTIDNKSIYFGLFRAERSIGAPADHYIWYSWQTPISTEPDFHIPSAFGTLIFKPH